MGKNLNILERSPLDCSSQGPAASEEATPEKKTWVASRYNVHATAADGRLVLWNTLHGSMSAFPANERGKVRSTLSKDGIESRAEGYVEYLRKRGFLVEKGTDEYRIFQHYFGQQHYRSDRLDLTLLASEDCNFRCEYCYERFARGTMQPWVRAGIKKLVESRAGKLRALKVSWFGGEPLYGFEAIEDLAPFFAEITSAHEITLGSSLTTNGYLLTPDVARKLLDWKVKNIQVTIDGAPEDHNRLRHTRTGEGTFDRIFDNIRSLRDQPDDFSMQIRINYDPESYVRVESFIDSLGDEFGNDPRFRLLLRPVGRWGGPRDRDLNVCGVEEQDVVTERLTELTRVNGLGNFDDLRRMGRFGSLACYAARPTHFIIGADGKVMKCTVALDTNEANIVGKLNEDGRLELDPAKVSFWTEPVFASAKKCQKCIVLPVCQSMACPNQRAKGATEAHCPPLRRNAKKSVVWTHKAAASDARTVKVTPSANPGA